MKQIIFLVLSLFVFTSWVSAFGAQISINQASPSYISHIEIDSEITRSDIFIFMGQFYAQYTPETSKYIDLKFKWIPKNWDLHEALQVLVYSDFIKNADVNIYPQTWLLASDFYVLSEKIFGIDFRNAQEKWFNKRYTDYSDIVNVSQKLEDITSHVNDSKDLEDQSSNEIDISLPNDSKNLQQKKAIFSDVYKTLVSDHYDKDSFDQEEIIYSAIQWLADGTDDRHTTYFPPVENTSFQQSLSWEYEGIGSYVEMPEPWIVQIISPIVGSPSEKAWIKWGDIITKIDDIDVTEKMSLEQAIGYIKWPAGTTVSLTIKRWNATVVIKVIRAKIIIKDVEYKSMNSRTFYIQIKNFWDNVDAQFKEALEELKTYKSTRTVVIDVRNNPGGYLWKVNNMLSYFVEKWKPVSIVRYQEWEVKHKSRWYDMIDFSEYKIVFLQNAWTASASEILIWTVKDYYPDAVLIWETSFGKWSVQDIKSYADGSSLKYTIAKWFTGKNQEGIDGIGISPDIELELDDERFQKGFDNQLERALKIR